MDTITKAHILELSILTILSLICAAAYHINERRKTRNSRAPHIKRHNENKEIHSPQSQAAQWISIKHAAPTWYKSIDIITPDGVIHKGWARVSDGDHNYYVSNKEEELSLIIPTIIKWRYV